MRWDRRCKTFALSVGHSNSKRDKPATDTKAWPSIAVAVSPAVQLLARGASDGGRCEPSIRSSLQLECQRQPRRTTAAAAAACCVRQHHPVHCCGQAACCGPAERVAHQHHQLLRGGGDGGPGAITRQHLLSATNIRSNSKQKFDLLSRGSKRLHRPVCLGTVLQPSLATNGTTRHATCVVISFCF